MMFDLMILFFPLWVIWLAWKSFTGVLRYVVVFAIIAIVIALYIS